MIGKFIYNSISSSDIICSTFSSCYNKFLQNISKDIAIPLIIMDECAMVYIIYYYIIVY